MAVDWDWGSPDCNIEPWEMTGATPGITEETGETMEGEADEIKLEAELVVGSFPKLSTLANCGVEQSSWGGTAL